MSYKILYTPAARQDIRDIKNYITIDLDNPISADNTIKSIIKRIKMLSEFPEIGIPVFFKTELVTNWRYLVCGSYLTFYTFKNNTVSVIRVIYSARDYLKILFGE